MMLSACFQAFHIKKYSLDSCNLLEDSKLLLWLGENYSTILELLDEELVVMNEMPLFVILLWLMKYYILAYEFT